MNPTASDGEYEVWHHKYSVFISIYCHNMSGNPLEYLTLPAGGASNYVYRGKWRKPLLAPCRGEFSKVRLLLTYPLKIFRNDTTFMKTIGSKCFPYVGYGGAKDCEAPYSITGKFSIDLSGTPYRIPDTVSWSPKGFSAKMSNYIKSNDGQRISANCGGDCGDCNPSSGKYLPLEFKSNYLLFY